MKEASLPEPVFKNERDDFVVTFYNVEYPELYPEDIINKTYDKTYDKLKEKILQFCKSEKKCKRNSRILWI